MTEERFYLYKLFENSPKVSLTHPEIADFYGESIAQIQTWIEEDLDLWCLHVLLELLLLWWW